MKRQIHIDPEIGSDRAKLRTRLGGAALVLLLHAALLLILTRPMVRPHAPPDLGRSVVPMTIYNLHARTSAPRQLAQEVPLLAKQKETAPEPNSRPPKPDSPVLEPDPAPELSGPSLVSNPALVDASPPVPDMPFSSPVPPGGETCNLVPALKASLESDVRVAAALRLIPIKSRSVANAVMMWDGNWVDAANLGGAAAVQPIRDALTAAIQGTSPDCLIQAESGPILIPVSDVYGTVILVVGSGSWQWRELLYESVPVKP